MDPVCPDLAPVQRSFNSQRPAIKQQSGVICSPQTFLSHIRVILMTPRMCISDKTDLWDSAISTQCKSVLIINQNKTVI